MRYVATRLTQMSAPRMSPPARSMSYLQALSLDEGAQERGENIGDGNCCCTQDSHSSPGWDATGRIGIGDVLQKQTTRRRQRDDTRCHKERNILNQVPKCKLEHRKLRRIRRRNRGIHRLKGIHRDLRRHRLRTLGCWQNAVKRRRVLHCLHGGGELTRRIFHAIPVAFSILLGDGSRQLLQWNG